MPAAPAGLRLLELLVRLSPGTNAEILWRPEDGSWRWRRDPFHYFFNQV